MIGYTHRLQAAFAAGVIPPGAVTSVVVAHTTGCHALAGGLCNCNPDIMATVGGEVLTIGAGGEVVERRRKQ